MKKDKLYTVGKGNQKQLSKAHLFDNGGYKARWDRLASAYYGADYGNPGSTVQDYMNDTGNNWFGLSKANNPFSKGNIGTTVGGLSAIAGNVGGGIISNGFSTGVGTGISSVGNAVGGVVSTFNPLLGGIISGASGLIGGAVNAGFGVKENKANVATIKNNTADARNAGNLLASSSSSNDFMANANRMAGSSGFGTTDLYKGGWFTKGKARKKGQKLINQENAALAYQGQGMQIGANNVDNNLDSTAMVNYAAYGGILDSLTNSGIGPAEYSLFQDYIQTKNKQVSNGDKLGGVSPTANTFKSGGKIHIKKSHRGRLTELKKRTGKTEAELYNDGNPAHKKMVVFARNARKWKKAYGGLLDATENLFAEGEPKGDKWVTPVGIVSAGGFVPNNTRGSYGGGRGSGGGAGTKDWDLPEYVTTEKNDTVWVPIERNFNDAFREAARKGLTEFEFNGTTYPVEYGDNPNWESAGNSRIETIGMVPITTKRKTTERKKSEGGPINVLCGGGKMFALGGDAQMHGADYSTGLSHIDAGKSHEENPNEGVQVGVDGQGVPNLVEENETIFNDYVYSARIELDEEAKKAFHIGKKRDITYADMSKKLEKEASERPNDPISAAALKVQMEDLAQHQERQKAEMQAEEARQAFEALSPEEQVAVMQEMQAQEQAAQEAAIQEQAMAEQQAMQGQQVPPEMMQQAPTEAMPQEQVLPQDANVQMAQKPVVATYGGRVNKFVYGGPTEDDIPEELKQNAEEAYRWLLRNYPDTTKADLWSLASTTANNYSSNKQANEARKQAVNYVRTRFPNISEASKNNIINRMLQNNNGSSFNPGAAFKKIVPTLSLNSSNYENVYRSLQNAGVSHNDIIGLMGDASKNASAETKRALNQIIDTLNNKFGSTASNTGIPVGTSVDAFTGATEIPKNTVYFETPNGIVSGTGTAEVEKPVNSSTQNASGNQNTGNTNPVRPATTRGATGLNLYGYYTNGSDGYSTPTGFKVGNNGRAYDYTDEYKNLVSKLGADDIRRWAAEHPDDVSLKSFIARGNNLDKLTDDQWRKGATDGKYGFMHHVADSILNGDTDPTNTNIDPVMMGQRLAGMQANPTVTAPTMRAVGMSRIGQTDPVEVKTITDANGNKVVLTTTPVPEEGTTTDSIEGNVNPEKTITPNHRAEWPRYAGLFGPAVGLGLWAAGVGKPNFSGLDSVLENYSRSGSYIPQYKGIGNYIAYRPMDMWAEQNRLDANARATDRAILNNASPVGTRNAALLANAYNNQIAAGNLYRQGLEYNDAKRAQVGEFNRRTDEFNAQAFNQNEQAKANILNADRQYRAQLAANIAAQKMDANAGWYNSLYGNLNNLFEGISDLGRENANWNMVSDMWADGLAGTISDKTNSSRGHVSFRAKGGKLKKKKRGLTF